MSPDRMHGNPPGPEEMIKASEYTQVALGVASMIAAQRKDREVGIGHLLMALDVDMKIWEILRGHGFTNKKGMDALKQIRGRNMFRRPSKTIPPESQDLKNLLDRTALNNLTFSGGMGEITSLNLLQAIVTSGYDGVKIGITKTKGQAGSKQEDLAWLNEGQQMLHYAGVDLDKLSQELTQKVADQYKPQDSTI